MEKEYTYIVQASQEDTKCKIGKTNDLERRLKEYNNMTGKSKENVSRYLFTCEVKNMTQVEKDIKKGFITLREEKNKEIYFFNKPLFENYVKFIKSHPLFVKEISIKTEDKKEIEKITEIVKKTTPSLDERGITRRDVLQKAQKADNDEFYTRYEDVEKEVSMYDKEIWKDKVVFCNCDDAVDTDDRNTSAFALFFLKNFNELELKKLICTHYGGGLDIFNQGAKGYVFTYIFTKNGFEEIKEYPKGYTGSFDDPLSIKILKEEADIVCTNPPFSKAKDYWKLVVESGKKFLIISNHTNVITKAFIPYFKENKVWAGYNDVVWFLNPKREIVKASGYWFTNFEINDRPKYKNIKIMPLSKIPAKKKKYDDFKMLVVDSNYIPSDYKNPFAVGVYPIVSGLLEKGYKLVQDKEYYSYINGEKQFARVLVQKV